MASERWGTLTAGLEYPNIETVANYYPPNLVKAQRTEVVQFLCFVVSL